MVKISDCVDSSCIVLDRCNGLGLGRGSPHEGIDALLGLLLGSGAPNALRLLRTHQHAHELAGGDAPKVLVTSLSDLFVTFVKWINQSVNEQSVSESSEKLFHCFSTY